MHAPLNPCPNPAARDAKILARYQAGDPIKAIAADEGVSISLVSKIGQRAGLRRHKEFRRSR